MRWISNRIQIPKSNKGCVGVTRPPQNCYASLKNTDGSCKTTHEKGKAVSAGHARGFVKGQNIKTLLQFVGARATNLRVEDGTAGDGPCSLSGSLHLRAPSRP